MPHRVNDILSNIINKKKETVLKRQLRIDLDTLKERLTTQPPVLRSFQKALLRAIQNQGIAIIAELKKASPSKGIFKMDYSPQKIAASYEHHGATCLSVLTEESFFLGSDRDLELARQACELPVLRKDFIIDAYQIYESRFLGADCILLIVAALSSQTLSDFYQLALELGLDVIVEVASEQEVDAALRIDATMIGINNRNLRDFTTDVKTTSQLKKLIPEDKIVICESGIKQRRDIDYMLSQHVHAFLIGEALMRADDPGLGLMELLHDLSH